MFRFKLIVYCLLFGSIISWSQETISLINSSTISQVPIQISYQNGDGNIGLSQHSYSFVAPSSDLQIKLLHEYLGSVKVVCSISKVNGGALNEVFYTENFGRIVNLKGLDVGETYQFTFFQKQIQEVIPGHLSIVSQQNSTVSQAMSVPYVQTYADQYTEEELVTDVLFNSGCVEVSNVTYSTHYLDGSPTPAIGYFDYAGTDFPFSDGVILSTGKIADAEGPKLGTDTDSNNGGGSDADISQILGQQGFSTDTNNTARLEFDFVAVTDTLAFNFIFASEEYRTFQCETSFADAFVFLFTDTATGQTSNLAVVPNTTTPISVYTVKNGANNNICASQNEQYFDVYYPGADNTAPINYKGRTVSLTAMSPITPGNTYHIKLAIADDGDTSYDSAVFIEGGSFDMGTVDLGEDHIVDNQTALCYGETYILTVDLDPDLWDIQWYKDGVAIPGATGVSYEVTESGVYEAVAVFGGSGNCQMRDSVVIEVLPKLMNWFNQPEDISVCFNDKEHVDITSNFQSFLGNNNPQEFQFDYFTSYSDAENNQNAIAIPTDYDTANGTDIYIRIKHLYSGCEDITSFKINVKDEIDVTELEDLIICDGYILPELHSYETYYTETNKGGEAYHSGDVLPVGIHTMHIYAEVDGCFDERSFEVNVLNCTIQKGISPNGDGLNDSLDLTNYGVEKIYIYNRYGTIVYKNEDNYTNEWVGQNMDGEALPSGTYYYEVYTPINYFVGWIQINR